MTSPPLNIPTDAEILGFSTNATGGHMARSMMLNDLGSLVRTLPIEARLSDYRHAILAENVLGKPTFASREKSLRHLIQLYGLDPTLPLFRLLRRFTAEDRTSLPLVALTCAFGRDPQLRYSFTLIERLKPNEPVSRPAMEAHLETGFPSRFSAAMKKSLAQNVLTSWTAAGHLVGSMRKRRALPEPRLAASIYAMLAGYLLGLRGELLVDSVFGRLVAPDATTVIAHLGVASARGWLRFRHAGGVLEIDFAPALSHEEQRVLHGTS